MRDNPYWALIVVFVPFSLVSIGGGASIFAGVQHQSVDVRQWVTAREFIDLFALSRAAPGPGSMLITLIGWKVAGLPGAFVATAALFVPSSILCYGLARVWNAHRGKPWHKALEAGLAPVGTGLVLAGAIAVMRLTGASVASWAAAGIVALILAFRPRLHPILLLAGSGALFAAYRLAWG
jgi:chromate transporter